MNRNKIAAGAAAGVLFVGLASGVAAAQLPEGYLQPEPTTTTQASGTTTTAPGSGVSNNGANQGGNGGSKGGGGALPRTGSDVLPLVGIASAAVLLGGAFVYGARRPRQA